MKNSDLPGDQFHVLLIENNPIEMSSVLDNLNRIAVKE